MCFARDTASGSALRMETGVRCGDFRHIPSSWESNSEGTGLRSSLESGAGGAPREAGGPAGPCRAGTGPARAWQPRAWSISTRTLALVKGGTHIHVENTSRGPNTKTVSPPQSQVYFRCRSGLAQSCPPWVSMLAAQKSREIRRKIQN